MKECESLILLGEVTYYIFGKLFNCFETVLLNFQIGDSREFELQAGCGGSYHLPCQEDEGLAC